METVCVRVRLRPGTTCALTRRSRGSSARTPRVETFAEQTPLELPIDFENLG